MGGWGLEGVIGLRAAAGRCNRSKGGGKEKCQYVMILWLARESSHPAVRSHGAEFVEEVDPPYLAWLHEWKQPSFSVFKMIWAMIDSGRVGCRGKCCIHQTFSTFEAAYGE